MTHTPVGKFYRKVKSCFKGEITFSDFSRDCFSHLLNLFRFQRRLRRRFFPINKVIFGLRPDQDLAKYKDFLDKYLSLSTEAGLANCNLANEFISPDRLHFAAKFKESIIVSVHLVKRFTYEGSEFWELSGLAVLKEYQGLGIAEHLIKTAIADLGAESGRVIYLTVENGNYRAVNLYHKLCFKEDDALSKKLIENKSFKDDTALKMFYRNYC